MRANGLPVAYVLYPEEGHGFAVPENSLSFNAIAETFLAAHLGGRSEPVGEDFAGAEFEVRAGAAQVPGLETGAGRPGLKAEMRSFAQAELTAYRGGATTAMAACAAFH